jgi:hypothetical protein
MAIAPKTIALIVGGLVVVGGGFALAPVLGDLFTQSVSPTSEILGEPVEFDTNANGETFGSPINDRVPDLILTSGDGGEIGYVRVSELDQARNLSRSESDPAAVFPIDVYESDGVTVVGTFTVDDETPGPRDGFNK